MPHGQADLGDVTPRSIFYEQGRFGRLFPSLPPFAADTPLIRDALAELGAQGGPMDAADDLSDPITLITDPAKSVNNPDNPDSTASAVRGPTPLIFTSCRKASRSAPVRKPNSTCASSRTTRCVKSVMWLPVAGRL